MKRAAILLLALGGLNPVAAQPLFEHGDVIVSTRASTGPFSFESRLLVYSGPGQVREIGFTRDDSFRETFVRNGLLHVARQSGVYKIDSTGRIVGRFIDGWRLIYMAPAMDGGVVASNDDGSLFRFASDGAIRVTRPDAGARGIDLAADGCTAFYILLILPASWDSCHNTEPVPLGGPGPGRQGGALRVLPDGSFIAAFFDDIAHYDSSGQLIRTYGIPAHAVALDVDGTSFWTGAGGTLLKVNIATGTILHSEFLDAGAILYLGVVGEPRVGLGTVVDIPLMSPALLLTLGLALAAVAVLKIG